MTSWDDADKLNSEEAMDLVDKVDVGEDEGGDPRCPVVLLLDTSKSMDGAPIQQLNEGLRVFESELKNDPLARRRCEIAIVSFGGHVETVQPFVLADEFSAPALGVKGNTPMGEAIDRAVAMVAERKKHYKDQGLKYYRPWIFMITDGRPTDDGWETAAQRVRDGDSPNEKRFMFFSVAVQGADMATLQTIAPPNRQPVMLKGLAFTPLFQWLSSSLSSVSGSNPGEQVPLAPMSGWAVVE